MSIDAPRGSQRGALARNAGALFALQFVNSALPFLLLPFLTRALGVPLYGVVAFGLAAAQVAIVLTDYGFNLSATYRIAKTSGDTQEVNRVIGAVLICKSVLLLLVLAAGAIVLCFQAKYEREASFLWLMMLTVIGQTYQPIWLFQGIERMGVIAFYTGVSRILFVTLVLVWVAGPTDLAHVAVASGVGSVVAAALGNVQMVREGLRPTWPGWTYVKATFSESTPFFWSRAAVSAYTAGGALFLGIASSPLQVAIYSAAEQLYRGVQALFAPVSQALYPYMARHKDYRLFFVVMKWVVAIAVVGVGITAIFGDEVLSLFYGVELPGSYRALVMFSLVFVITAPSILLGYPFLGALGQVHLANRSVLFAGGCQVVLLLLIWMSGHAEALGVAASVLLVELIVLGLRMTYARQHYQAHAYRAGL